MALVRDSAKLVDGHYQVALPLKKGCVNMPNNKKGAEQRALDPKKEVQKELIISTTVHRFYE